MQTLDRAHNDATALIGQSLDRMLSGQREGLDDLYTDDAINHEAIGEPPAARVPGPDGAHATSVWLRGAFSDLRYEIETVAVDGDQVVVRTIMRGRHTGDFVTWEPDGTISAFPATGQAFEQGQMHWFTLRDERISEHRAQRDDLGMARQLHWIPPAPRYLVRMARARRRAARHYGARHPSPL
jgi:predicted ester cyclase